MNGIWLESWSFSGCWLWESWVYNAYSKVLVPEHLYRRCYIMYTWVPTVGEIAPSSGFATEKAMAPHSSTLAWKIPWKEEPGGLQSMGSLRVGHDWVTSLSRIGEGNGNPFQCSCLENPRDGGAWWAAVSGVAQSWTWLKRLSSSSGFANRTKHAKDNSKADTEMHGVC